MEDKVERAKRLIDEAANSHAQVAVACSFGKDSMVVVHLAREVDPQIKIFSVMTQYKPVETFQYLRRMDESLHLGTTVYMVADETPEALNGASVDMRLLPAEEFHARAAEIEGRSGQPIYDVDPDECCRLLKVEPTKSAVSGLDAWICGLRNTEGRTRVDYQEVEHKGGLVKVNPILTFTEAEIWRYLATRGIEPHPWYGLGYRSLGCAPCSHIGGELERDGRWKGTSKCGGECGIHTQRLK